MGKTTIAAFKFLTRTYKALINTTQHTLSTTTNLNMPLTFTTRGSICTFTLLDSEGEAMNGFSMECTFPTAESNGKAVYENGAGAASVLEFVYDQETKGFKAWHVSRPEQVFSMVPIIVGTELVGMDVVFSHMEGFVAHFALNLGNEFEDVIYDIFAPPVFCNEMFPAQF